MSHDADRMSSDAAGQKKRKRKRGKSQATTVGEPAAANNVSKVNKKTKFDDDGTAKPASPVPETNDVPTEQPEPQAKPAEPAPVQESSQENLQDKKRTVTKPVPLANKKPVKKRVFFDGEGSDADDDDDEASSFKIANTVSRDSLRARAQGLLEVRRRLPIYQHKDKILDYINRNQVVVIIGETGSGKSTQIPQFLIPGNKKRIVVTQPRRVAAASLAARVAEEYGCFLGDEIGYQVRFSNITSHKTKVAYLTDGMLIRELMLDPLLLKYTTIVIDEAHERTVLTDLILGFLKQLIIQKKRQDLKLIIMSATLNADLFSKFFDHAPILYVEGKMYPVTRQYLSGVSDDIVDTMVKAVVQVNSLEQEGDVLCFLPGQEEIDNCVNILNTLAPELPKDAPRLVPLPLYAALSPGQQLKIFEKYSGRKRKVILATNIAETSITVSGVKYVIDSGLRKVKVWKHQLGLSTLLTTPISRASAQQRAGRAGRESAGKVFRLYSEKLFHSKLPAQQESEIMRNDVVLPVLTLKKMGVDNLLDWTWLEHPGKEAILAALTTLYSLKALDDSGKVTPLGYKMAVLPLPPALSAVMISALNYGVIRDVIDIVSCLSVDNLILNVGGQGELRDEINAKRRQYCPMGTRWGDLIALKEYFGYFKQLHDANSTAEAKLWCKELFFSFKGFKNVLKVRRQLIEYMASTIKQDDSLTPAARSSELERFQELVNSEEDERDELDDGFTDRALLLDTENILKSFLEGFALNTAIGMPDRSFRTCSSGQLISIHPSSNLFGKANLDSVMYIEYVYTAKAYGRTCSRIELSWLQEVAPHLLGGTKLSITQ